MTPSIGDVCTKKLVITKFAEAVNLIIKKDFRIKAGSLFSYFHVFFLEKSRFGSQKIIISKIFIFFPKTVLISLVTAVDPKTTDLAFVL